VRLQALGYYPSNFEIRDLTHEVKRKKKESVSLSDLVRLYVNHKPVQEVSLQDLRQAFVALGAEQITGISSVRRRACACNALLPCAVRHIAHQEQCCARLRPRGWGPVDDGTHSRACDAGTLKWESLRLMLLRIGEPLTDPELVKCLQSLTTETLNGREDFSAPLFAEQILGFEGMEEEEEEYGLGAEYGEETVDVSGYSDM
jgi:hypothetical protein